MINWIEANIASHIFSKFLDFGWNRIVNLPHKWDREKLLEEYNQQFKRHMENALLDEEVDFGGLMEFIAEDFENRVIAWQRECIFRHNVITVTKLFQLQLAALEHEGHPELAQLLRHKYQQLLQERIKHLAGPHGFSTSMHVNSLAS